MKKHLAFYGILIILFIVYNLFFQVEDPKTNTAFSILFSSIIFGYIAYMAFVLLKKMGKNK